MYLYAVFSSIWCCGLAQPLFSSLYYEQFKRFIFVIKIGKQKRLVIFVIIINRQNNKYASALISPYTDQ